VRGEADFERSEKSGEGAYRKAQAIAPSPASLISFAAQASLRSLPKVGCEPGHDERGQRLLEKAGSPRYTGGKPQ